MSRRPAPAFALPSSPFSATRYSHSFLPALPPRGPPRRPRTALCNLPHHSRRKRTAQTSDPCFIPQTIEYAIRRAQAATAQCLSSGITHARVELPMGRSRKHWYRMSPVDSWYTETSVLAFHFCEMFKGLDITLILGTGPGVTHRISWLHDVCRADDIDAHNFSDAPDRVVVIAGVSQRQRAVISRVLKAAPGAQAYILFNCLLDVPLSQELTPFTTAYACRALEKCATLKDGFSEPWAAFVEIAIFEYEWIGMREEAPTQRGIETLAAERGARKKGLNGYYETEFAGCEAGFWPFMTVCCREVLPMDGAAMAKVEKDKADRKARKTSRPFGFF